MPARVLSLPREIVPTQRKTCPPDGVTLYYRHIDVEVDQKTVALARRHIQRLPVGTMRSLRCALVLSLDGIAVLEAERIVDAMDALCIDLIFLRALDECLLDREQRLLGSGLDHPDGERPLPTPCRSLGPISAVPESGHSSASADGDGEWSS